MHQYPETSHLINAFTVFPLLSPGPQISKAPFHTQIKISATL